MTGGEGQQEGYDSERANRVEEPKERFLGIALSALNHDSYYDAAPRFRPQIKDLGLFFGPVLAFEVTKGKGRRSRFVAA
jgi:hypothetical protein